MDDSAGLEMNCLGCLGTGCPVEVISKSEATCAFSNIANLCYPLTDEIAGEIFKDERYMSGRVLVKDHIVDRDNWDGLMNS
eukprot:1392518-Ditylum_brightwellii.AAC.1